MNPKKIYRVLSNIPIITIVSVMFGIFIRLYHLFYIGIETPYRLGGLFLAFAREIFKNGYSLPDIIPNYTEGGLLFAYPPLPFYIESILVFDLKIPEFLVVNVLPILVSIISLLFFAFLIRKTNISENAKNFAIILFSIMPQAYSEQTMGAGLAESFGTLSLIIFFFGLFVFFKHQNIKSTIFLSFCFSFCIYSSPGSALGSIIVLITSLIFHLIEKYLSGEKINSNYFLDIIKFASLLFFLTLVITAPYWLNVIFNHGIDIFLRSISYQYNSENSGWLFLINSQIRNLLHFNFIYISVSGIWNAFIVIGLFILLSRKQLVVPMSLFSILIIPREAIWIIPIFGAVISGFYFSAQKDILNKNIIYPIIFSIFLLNSIFYIKDSIPGNINSNENLTAEDITTIMNLKNQISKDNKIILICQDGFTEWFPYIAEKTVLNVEYGTEFMPEKNKQISTFNDSLINCLDIDCVINLTNNTFGYEKYYFIIDKQKVNQNFNIQGLFGNKVETQGVFVIN